MKNNRVATLSVAILVISAFVAAYEPVAIYPLDTAAAAGSQNVSVPVSVNNNDSIAIFEFQISHSEYLIFKGTQATERMINATIETNAVNRSAFAVAAFIPGNISAGNGTIINLIFDVNASAVPGNYSIAMSNVLLTNADVDTLPYNSVNAVFAIL